MTTVIEARNVSKQFLLRHNASVELKVRFLGLLSPKHRQSVEEFWALKNVSLQIARGEAVGTLFGGCLSLTTALTGTPYDYWIDDGIWFWEDVDEPVYRIDRMLTHLRLSGRMQRVRGVVIGTLKDCGEDAEMQVFLRDFFTPFGIPVITNFPLGHHGDNLLMPIGRTVRLSTLDHTFTVTEPAVI